MEITAGCADRLPGAGTGRLRPKSNVNARHTASPRISNPCRAHFLKTHTRLYGGGPRSDRRTKVTPPQQSDLTDAPAKPLAASQTGHTPASHFEITVSYGLPPGQSDQVTVDTTLSVPRE